MSSLSSPRPADSPTRLGAWLSTALDRTTARQSTLWALAIVALLLDVVTTTYGLQLGLAEMNPIVNYLLPTLGLFGTFTVLKGWALLVGIVAWWVLPPSHRGLVPLGLAIPWFVAVTNNSVLLATLLL